MEPGADGAGLERVADHVRQRRHKLGLTIDDAARSVRMSAVTWTRVEKGLPVRSLTYAGIERALDWSAGSVDALMADGTPPSVQDRTRDRTTTAPEEDDLDPVDRLIQEIYDDPDMPPERKHEWVRIIRKADAQREAELRAAQDELAAWRRRNMAG